MTIRTSELKKKFPRAPRFDISSEVVTVKFHPDQPPSWGHSVKPKQWAKGVESYVISGVKGRWKFGVMLEGKFSTLSSGSTRLEAIYAGLNALGLDSSQVC